MKALLTCTCAGILLIAMPARGDVASHAALALEYVHLTISEPQFRAGFETMTSPVYQNFRKQGASEEALAEIRQVITKWFEGDVKISDLEPKLAELCQAKFTEAELREIVTFLKTPAGGKMQTEIDALRQQIGALGGKYFEQKLDLLKKQLQPTLEKYKLHP